MYSRFGYIRHLGNLAITLALIAKCTRLFGPLIALLITLLAMTIYYTPKGYNSA